MTWKALHHPNVLPLLGVITTNNQFAMVSEWMINGNISEFIKTCEDANRFELVRFSFYCRPHLAYHYLIIIASRCRSRVDIYARGGDSAWRSEGRGCQNVETALFTF